MHRSWIRFFIPLVALISSAFQESVAGSRSAKDLVGREISAVVSISVLRAGQTGPIQSASDESSRPDTANVKPSVARGTRVLGSGFIVEASGIIVTNRHVVDGATDILVTLSDNTLLRAELFAQASDYDVALLRVSPSGTLPVIYFGDSDTVQIGDSVLAIGNPLGLSGSVTRGIVSALNRDIHVTPFDDFIQTDAAINHGNSGGPLFNEKGEVIGMNTAIFSPQEASGSIGLGFAIPSNDVKFVVDALRNPNGGLRHGTLSFRIQQVTAEIADALNMPKAEGVIVGGTKLGGAANECGIIPGDIVLKYGTMAVKDVRALSRAIARTAPGTVVDLLIWRNEEPTIVAARIQELPQAAPLGTPRAFRAFAAEPGWELAPLGDKARYALGMEPTATGVAVKGIVPGGAAAEAGVLAGDIIVQIQQDKIGDGADVGRVISLARQQQRHYVAILVNNPDGLRWVSLSLE